MLPLAPYLWKWHFVTFGKTMSRVSIIPKKSSLMKSKPSRRNCRPRKRCVNQICKHRLRRFRISHKIILVAQNLLTVMCRMNAIFIVLIWFEGKKKFDTKTSQNSLVDFSLFLPSCRLSASHKLHNLYLLLSLLRLEQIAIASHAEDHRLIFWFFHPPKFAIEDAGGRRKLLVQKVQMAPTDNKRDASLRHRDKLDRCQGEAELPSEALSHSNVEPGDVRKLFCGHLCDIRLHAYKF